MTRESRIYWEEVNEIRLGSYVGEFRVTGLIDKGRMWSVMRATAGGRSVALWLFPSSRFYRDAIADFEALRLAGHAALEVCGVGSFGRLAFVATEAIGDSVVSLQEVRPASVGQAIDYVLKVCRLLVRVEALGVFLSSVDVGRSFLCRRAHARFLPVISPVAFISAIDAEIRTDPFSIQADLRQSWGERLDERGHVRLVGRLLLGLISGDWVTYHEGDYKNYLDKCARSGLISPVLVTFLMACLESPVPRFRNVVELSDALREVTGEGGAVLAGPSLPWLNLKVGRRSYPSGAQNSELMVAKSSSGLAFAMFALAAFLLPVALHVAPLLVVASVLFAVSGWSILDASHRALMISPDSGVLNERLGKFELLVSSFQPALLSKPSSAVLLMRSGLGRAWPVLVIAGVAVVLVLGRPAAIQSYKRACAPGNLLEGGVCVPELVITPEALPKAWKPIAHVRQLHSGVLCINPWAESCPSCAERLEENQRFGLHLVAFQGQRGADPCVESASDYWVCPAGDKPNSARCLSQRSACQNSGKYGVAATSGFMSVSGQQLLRSGLGIDVFNGTSGDIVGRFSVLYPHGLSKSAMCNGVVYRDRTSTEGPFLLFFLEAI